MGKKQKEQNMMTAQKMGSHANSKKGGLAGKQNSLAAKNDFCLADELKKGRHECLCQARIHELILNCLGCGRIVCAQEGSGPCFTCGTMVCTREEREILNRGSKKSAELLAKLKSNEREYQNAEKFRDKLLEADADTERRTYVNDLESDYSNAESNPFINAEEREALKKRREELRILREKQRNQFVVSIDVDNGIVQQLKQPNSTDHVDPIIQRIIEKADERRRAEEAAHNSASDARWNPIGFVPKYLIEEGQQFDQNCSDGDIIDAESLLIVSDELAAQIVEEKGWTIGLNQPIASFLVNGLVRYVRWHQNVLLKGPIFVAAKPGAVDEETINQFAKDFVKGVYKSKNIDFSDGSLLGRAYLTDCQTVEDFDEIALSAVPGVGDFVLCFTGGVEPFATTVPHISNSDELYELDRQLKRTVVNW